MNSDFCVAVHGLVYLSHKGCVLQSGELAENICTNPARVRKVMATLKKAGFVTTKEGSVTGGYRFAGEASQITLSQVAEAVGVRFVAPSWHSGDTSKECLVASGMAGIMDEIFECLDSSCKEKLKTITIADIDAKIFSGSDKPLL